MLLIKHNMTKFSLFYVAKMQLFLLNDNADFFRKHGNYLIKKTIKNNG